MKRVLLGLLVLTGCATLGGRGADANFSREVGRATAPEVWEGAHRVLTMHQFEIEQETGPPQIYIGTRWRDRAPFSDEMERGIDEAQVRAQIRATARSDTGLELYTVNLKVEHRVRNAHTDEWILMTASPKAEAYSDRIASDLRRILSIGVHR